MKSHPYWHQQTSDKPMYPDIEWSKPEQKSKRGKLGLIGGNKLGFISMADSHNTALKAGVGEVRMLLPDVLKKTIPSTITEVIFGKTNPSGGLSHDSINEMKTISEWADGILLIGDAGRNSETAVLYENFIQKYDGLLTVTRDSIDLVVNNSTLLIERPKTLLVTSFAQLQKIFQSVYYPKVLTFSMQLNNLVDALHKFTITYPVCIAVFHNDTVLVASNGEVTSTPYSEAMRIWRGETATIATTYWLWNQEKMLGSVTASLLNKS